MIGHGNIAAVPCNIRLTKNENETKQLTISVASIVSQHIKGDTLRYTEPLFGCDIRSESWSIEIKPLSRRLIAESYKQSDPYFIFLLRWMALETQCGQYSSERRRFFIETLRSNRINEDVKAISDIRNAIFHGGERPDDLSCSTKRLELILRICCINSSELRNALIAHYESLPRSCDAFLTYLRNEAEFENLHHLSDC
jgi:hypothetical protein